MNRDRNHSKSRRTKAIENRSPLARLFMSSARSAGIAFLAALAFIFIGCFIGYSLRDPAKCVHLVSLVALYASFFICGFISSRFERGNPLLTGAFSAVVYLIPILLMSLILKSPQNSASATGDRTLTAVMTIPCSVIGAFIGNVRIASRKPRSRIKKR